MDTSMDTSMDTATLLAAFDFSRMRLIAILDAIESKARERNLDIGEVLAWRPLPGRAHIGWQAMHCAATHDRNLNMHILGKGAPTDADLVASFAGGSTPADANVPTLPQIKEQLAKYGTQFRDFIATVSREELAQTRPGPGGKPRMLGESIILLIWHETHHQGQIHLTWNLFKAAHGIS